MQIHSSPAPLDSGSLAAASQSPSSGVLAPESDDVTYAGFLAAPAALAIVDAFGVVIAHNLTFDRVVGWRRRSLGRPATFDALFALTDQPAVRLMLSTARKGEAINEARLCDGTGNARVVRIAANRVEITGRGSMVIVNLIDPAEIHANGDLSMDEDQVSRARIASLHHDLRTPLNAIKGFGEMLAGDVMRHGIAHQYRAYAGHIVDAATHLLDSFDRILAVRANRSQRSASREIAAKVVPLHGPERTERSSSF